MILTLHLLFTLEIVTKLKSLFLIAGSYSYIDPNHRIRTVEYIADKEGFHPVTNEHVAAVPLDTPVVAAAKQQHLQKYNAIKHFHETLPNVLLLPADTTAVEHAKNKHFALFKKIADEHTKMAAELKSLEKANKPEEVQLYSNEQY